MCGLYCMASKHIPTALPISQVPARVEYATLLRLILMCSTISHALLLLLQTLPNLSLRNKLSKAAILSRQKGFASKKTAQNYISKPALERLIPKSFLGSHTQSQSRGVAEERNSHSESIHCTPHRPRGVSESEASVLLGSDWFRFLLFFPMDNLVQNA